MAIQLSATLKEYFRAKNAHDVDAMAACFAEDAVVIDEGEELRGSAAIAQWIEATTQKYRVTATAKNVEEANGETIVTAEIAGNFNGSPLDLRFCFILEDDTIKFLAVRG